MLYKLTCFAQSHKGAKISQRLLFFASYSWCLCVFVAIFFSLCISNQANAQNQKQVEKDKAKKLSEANFLLEGKDFKNALNLYAELYKADTNDYMTGYRVGVCMYNLRKYKKDALQYLEKAAAKGINEANYYSGNLYHLSLRFEDALKAYNTYSSFTGQKNFDDGEINMLKAKTKTAMEIMKSPIDVTIENMGNKINSVYPDYAPLISADESVLMFTSRRKGSSGEQDPNGDYFEDIYISYKKDGKWTEPVGISPNINTPTHEATVALSADGENLYLYRTSEELTGGNIYLSKFNGIEWSKPEKLKFEINTQDGWESSATIASGGKAFYFSSNREGGYGGKDIYRIVELPNGIWSKALNLGPTVNTLYDEDFPFIHPDNKTLYFSSKAHKNMGGFDIFKTIVDEYGKCTEPENLGYPINTIDNDVCFVLSANGKRGYYSSNRTDGMGEEDIYTINMPNETTDVVVLKAQVLSEDQTPLKSRITLTDDKTETIKGRYNSNANTGKFILILEKEKTYKLLVEANGYYSYTSIINASDINDELKKINLVKQPENK